MIVLLGGRPVWACDVCLSTLDRVPTVLYGPSQQRNHLPVPRLCCSPACEVLAERQLTTGTPTRLSWKDFLRALNEGIVGVSV
jgi:hypothetical protein